MVTLEPPRGLALDAGQAAWAELGLSAAGLGRFLSVARAAVGLRGAVDVLLAGDRTLRRLNREFRGKDKATDVLSFPAATEMGEEFAGDLAISLETAGRQARAHGHSLRDEVRVLLLHGLLHLSGMDHEGDAGEMAARERELRVRLRLAGGLIERVKIGVAAGSKQVPRSARNGNAKKKSKGKATTESKAKALNATESKARALNATESKARALNAAGAMLQRNVRGVRRGRVVAR